MVTNENCHKVEAFHPNLGKTVGPDGAADPHGAADGLIGAGSCFFDSTSSFISGNNLMRLVFAHRGYKRGVSMFVKATAFHWPGGKIGK